MGAYEDDVPMEENDGVKDEDKMDFAESDDEAESEKENNPPGARNTLLAVGFKEDRSYVVRGNKIGVFKHTSDDIDYTTTIDNISTLDKRSFTPTNLMLHQKDSSLLLLHPDIHTKVFKMDLDRGKVVEEWNLQDHKLQELLPDEKYAQTTQTPTLLGLNNAGVFTIDSRTPEKLVRSKCFQYTSGAKLKCGATTSAGHLAVGTAKGEIKLFNYKRLQASDFSRHNATHVQGVFNKLRATTNLPGFGDPIIGIDVTADGKWILGTCKSYLLVVPTQLEGGVTGFEKQMGQKKPMPRRLQLKNQHIKLVGGNVSFTPARFNLGESERSIVTSTGPFVITWNFRKVKQNALDQYQIKKYSQNIVADQFKYGEDKAIIVTMPDDVRLAKRHAVKDANLS